MEALITLTTQWKAQMFTVLFCFVCYVPKQDIWRSFARVLQFFDWGFVIGSLVPRAIYSGAGDGEASGNKAEAACELPRPSLVIT